MAKLKNKILGKVSGSLGDITFRQRNGLNYLSMRPANYKIPTDDESIKRRNKFILAVKLASAVNALSTLKYIWSEFIPQGTSVYNYLVQEYFKFLNVDSLLEDINLTPGFGFIAGTEMVNITAEQIAVNVNQLGSNNGIVAVDETKLKLISVLFLSVPQKTGLDAVKFIPFEFPVIDTVLNAQLNFVYSVSSQLSGLMSGYSQQQLLFALTTLDNSQKPVHYSNTFAL